ncbi:MAG: DUF4038 domain-containing protein [Sedimentisphaerales bacterium]|nr:DUF4038 domain-containing protein [Sedimentisphaerales bacterium]
MSDLRRFVAAEWSFESSVEYDDPFNEVDLDVVEGPAEGKRYRVPGFWAGGKVWKVRFAAETAGEYKWVTECSDSGNKGLHGLRGEFKVQPYKGDNKLYAHGPIRVSKSKKHFEHSDGEPFFWLGDTWWMSLCERLKWDGFKELVADRVAKGFNVVQLVAGLYPDMDWYDERGKNEAGYPFDKDFERINPAYYDAADKRVQYLADAGLVPCVVGSWGYYLPWLGVEKLKRFWRYLIARWGALPVAWCLAGEARMPYYLSKHREAEEQQQFEGWSEISRYVRQTDPMGRPITIHPSCMQPGREQVTDAKLIDFEMLQSGHGGYDSVPNTISSVVKLCAAEPKMPVLEAEVNYEGFLHGTYDEVQRMAFWGSVLSGGRGHTYGANGIWQVNTRQQVYGASPHGNTWGNLPWDDAMNLPGSGQLGVGKKLLERYRWWEFEPHQEWLEPAADAENRWGHYAAGIQGQVRVIYTYQVIFLGVPGSKPVLVQKIEAGVNYRAFFVNPSTGQEHDLGAVKADEEGNWPIPQQPEARDWLLVLEAE